ncbi:C4-dicarboxylate transporter/malic acid transport family protein, partial [Vibrio cholerae O1 str. EM-1676A]
CWLTP